MRPRKRRWSQWRSRWSRWGNRCGARPRAVQRRARSRASFPGPDARDHATMAEAGGLADSLAGAPGRGLCRSSTKRRHPRAREFGEVAEGLVDLRRLTRQTSRAQAQRAGRLCWTDSSTPRLLGGEEARSLAGRATGSLRHQGSAHQAALVPRPSSGPACLWLKRATSRERVSVPEGACRGSARRRQLVRPAFPGGRLALVACRYRLRASLTSCC